MDNATDPKLSSTNQRELTCPSCAGNLVYAPGTRMMRCEHCGAEVEIVEAPTISIDELDFEDYIARNQGSIETQTLHTVRCSSCGAHVSFDEHVTSDRCPFCSSVMVVTDTISETQIKPGLLLPFKLNQPQATERFGLWLKGLWFAPSKLKRLAVPQAIKGIYIPYWTFDAHTTTHYRGQRGDSYTTTISVPVTRNGRTSTETRTVTKIRWRPASGVVVVDFDDVLVLASNSIPAKEANRLEPWDLPQAVPYNEMYLSGYRTEAYQIDLQQGFALAKQRMAPQIDAAIRRDIGGDHQRITSRSTEHSDITFKHTLLPIYISSFRYKDKVYRFLINARTGKVYGQRPYSVLKITLAVLLAAAIIGLAYLLINKNGSSESNTYQYEYGYDYSSEN